MKVHAALARALADQGVDTIFHLAGEPVAESRWNAAKKQRLRDSRVFPTRNLIDAVGALGLRPKTLVCASAVGYYGDRGWAAEANSAFSLLTLLGAAGEELGMDCMLKTNTSKTRTLSLFRQGLQWYELLPNMPEKRLKPLMAKFDELVQKHEITRSLLGAI